jgi:molecular chaperone GrpE
MARRVDGPCGAEDAESTPQLQLEVVRLREELASERELSLRAIADFDNYRRRVRRERAAADHSGQGALLLALLEVADDFDRALAHVGETSDAVVEGLRLIHRRLDGVLRSNGVTSFESEGRPFDPTVHEATSTVESGELESGAVHTVERRGYLWNGELLRPARVVVVR